MKYIVYDDLLNCRTSILKMMHHKRVGEITYLYR